jgi:hypothetical protein
MRLTATSQGPFNVDTVNGVVTLHEKMATEGERVKAESGARGQGTAPYDSKHRRTY